MAMEEHPAVPQPPFLEALLEAVVRGSYEFQSSNTDFLRFQMRSKERLARQARDLIFRGARRWGFIYVGRYTVNRALGVIAEWPGGIGSLEETYDRLADSYSRHVMIETIAFQILGEQRIKFAVNYESYWNFVREERKKILEQPQAQRAGPWWLDLYRVPRATRSIRLLCHPLNLWGTFFLEQYAYLRGSQPIAPEPGDTVIDAGANWGDTALYFADRVGETGHVYSFEFEPANLQVLETNLRLNPPLAKRIGVIHEAVWDATGQELMYTSAGPSSWVKRDGATSDAHVNSISIDDFVSQQNITRVDFLKMDVEGAELAALRGSERTLLRDRPKLAIAVYHRREDLTEIADYLRQLNADYELYLDHFSLHGEETVLFALSKGSKVRTGRNVR